MGYLNIENLYKVQHVLLFREVYAMEKIHGTSAYIEYNSMPSPQLTFFPGGVELENFTKLFDKTALLPKLQALGVQNVVVFGEAYGGKCQAMKDTYGPDLRFIAFDVRMDERWLEVPDAEKVATDLGLEFVPYHKVSAAIETLDAERDRPSEIATRRGMGDDKLREGIVIRPLVEMHDGYDNRIIAKHKGEAFSERVRTPRPHPGKLEVLTAAQAIADEWVTPQRVCHVAEHVKAAKPDKTLDLSDMPALLGAIVEDVEREGKGEITESKDARRAISAKAAPMFKSLIRGSVS